MGFLYLVQFSLERIFNLNKTAGLNQKIFKYLLKIRRRMI